MSSENLHEPIESLSQETIEMHRAIVSLIEEFEAIDWYQQRAEASADPELKRVLLHHKREEMEHALMNLEWMRRNDPEMDAMCRTYLFTEGPITEVEEEAEGRNGGGETKASSSGSLGIGRMDPTSNGGS